MDPSFRIRTCTCTDRTHSLLVDCYNCSSQCGKWHGYVLHCVRTCCVFVLLKLRTNNGQQRTEPTPPCIICSATSPYSISHTSRHTSHFLLFCSVLFSSACFSHSRLSLCFFDVFAFVFCSVFCALVWGVCCVMFSLFDSPIWCARVFVAVILIFLLHLFCFFLP